MILPHHLWVSETSSRYLRCTTCGCQVGVRLLLLTLSGPHAAQIHTCSQPTSSLAAHSTTDGPCVLPQIRPNERPRGPARRPNLGTPPQAPQTEGKSGGDRKTVGGRGVTGGPLHLVRAFGSSHSCLSGLGCGLHGQVDAANVKRSLYTQKVGFWAHVSCRGGGAT